MSSAAYADLERRCRAAVHRGALQESRELATQAAALALELGDADLIERSTTLRSMVLLEAGDPAAAENGLREVLLATADDGTACRAAFYLASSLRRQGKVGRALVFAQRAGEKAAALRDPVWKARCQNLIGNIHLNKGDMEAADRAYGRALRLWTRLEGDHRFALAIVRDNLGYCRILRRRFRSGLALLNEALATARAIGDRRTEAECSQDLAHAELTRGHAAQARPFALSALRLAEEGGYRDVLQNACYLLGEIARLERRDDECEHYFNRLQAFFPQVPRLREFLRAFDISSILTLH